MNTTHPSGERLFFGIAAALILAVLGETAALVIDAGLAIGFALVFVVVLTVALLALTGRLLSDRGDDD